MNILNVVKISKIKGLKLKSILSKKKKSVIGIKNAFMKC
jgi:hypothetical protein